MVKEIYFVSGVHGVGKGTLCRKLNRELGLPVFSCSDLIKQNSEYVENSKVVATAERNQEALLQGLKCIKDDRFLLDGHFCLLGPENTIIELENSVFDMISPIAVINVTCDVSIVRERLLQRDGKAVESELLEAIQRKEVIRAEWYCENRNIELIKYESADPIEPLIDYLKRN
ncbi:ATP-binding protein [Vibrio alfacsensis]|uniref:ATP-binding protein n=1 Tax=Vibrio alfacsensis TaxID=1074311 RepID=UPI002ADE373F|nr:ATP-binding protein [Vibrio alfacsensis]WQE78008.1 ATP-binding protein [Vibrio alfacsensis]